MNKVCLKASEVKQDIPDLVLTFIHRANEQGFDLEWVEMIINKIEANYYQNTRAILLEHIEIIHQ